MSGYNRVLRRRNPIVIDLVFLFAVVIYVVLLSAFELPIVATDAIPTIMNGLTTATSILIGISGLSLSREFSRSEKSVDVLRASIYTLMLAVILAFIGIAYLNLAMGGYVLAFKISFLIFQLSYLILATQIFRAIFRVG